MDPAEFFEREEARQVAESAALRAIRGERHIAQIPDEARPRGSVSDMADGRTQPMKCQYCGKTVNGGQGKASHERHCAKKPHKAVPDVLVSADGDVVEPAIQTVPADTWTQMDSGPDEAKPKTVGRLVVDVTYTTELLDELIDTRLRLIGAMVDVSEMPVSTKQALMAEVDRIRELAGVRR